MSKLIKLLIVFAVIAGLFMYYPASTGDEEPNQPCPPRRRRPSSKQQAPKA